MRRLALALSLALVALPAWAGQTVTLKAQIFDPDGVITLGEIFDNARAAGQIVVASREGQTTVLDAALVQSIAHRNGLDWANSEGLRRIIVSGQPAAAQRANIDVLTYSRNLSAGEMVQPTDLIWAKVASAPSDSASDADQLIGMVAKRPLRMGAAAARHDVSAQVVIRPGDLVNVTYQAEGISLTLQAKAVGAAAVGEPIDIQNTASKKIIQAVASGPGQAVVGPLVDQVRAASRTQLALR
jgi:flagellar basal body P-ring formation protein FlgA